MRLVCLSLALLCLAAPAVAACPDQAAVDALAAAIRAKTPATFSTPIESSADAACWRERLVAAEEADLGPPIGYKVGLTSKPAQERLGATAPVYGVLLEKMILPAGSTVSAIFGAKPLFEADMLVTVKSDAINQARTPQDVLANISDVRPFIELADLVVADGVKMTPDVITAINVGARLGVAGDPIPAEDSPVFLAALGNMQVSLVSSTSGEIVKAPGKAILGHPLNAVIWLLEQGVTLKAGDVVSLGSFGPLTPAKPDQTITATYRGLPGDPSVSVTLE